MYTALLRRPDSGRLHWDVPLSAINWFRRCTAYIEFCWFNNSTSKSNKNVRLKGLLDCLRSALWVRDIYDVCRVCMRRNPRPNLGDFCGQHNGKLNAFTQPVRSSRGEVSYSGTSRPSGAFPFHAKRFRYHLTQGKIKTGKWYSLSHPFKVHDVLGLSQRPVAECPVMMVPR